MQLAAKDIITENSRDGMSPSYLHDYEAGAIFSASLWRGRARDFTDPHVVAPAQLHSPVYSRHRSICLLF